MINFANSTETVANSQIIDGTEFGANVATAIAKAVNDGNLDTIGLTKEMEDDGAGNLTESGSYEIIDETAFAAFILATDTTFRVSTPAPIVNTNSNQTAAQVWLTSNAKVHALPNLTDKIIGKVLRYHVSMVDGKPIGLSLTFQTNDGKSISNNNTALIAISYLASIINPDTKKLPTVAELMAWANSEIKDAVIVLGARHMIAGETAYYKSIATLNPLEQKAYAAVKDKSLVKKSDDNKKVGFVHRVTGTAFTFGAVASSTETLQFNTQVSRLSELTLKVAEKTALDRVDLGILAEKQKIVSQDIKNQISVAKLMLEDGDITQEQYDKRVNSLLDNFGMK